MNPSTEFWGGRRVLVTGHTGFKGAWLIELLWHLGADVVGLSWSGAPRSGTYELLGHDRLVQAHDVDVRDLAAVRSAVADAKASTVLHLAAQALVPASFADPIGTFAVNVMGTANVLDAVLDASDPTELLVVTSDKVYANDGSGRAFVEGDPLGGKDPYSGSKAAAELVVASWRQSLVPATGSLRTATARAGNVIGGGDRAEGRLLPDVFRALDAGHAVELRHPDGRRPWQFVLDPLVGYLLFAERLAGNAPMVPALNFGPDSRAAETVSDVVRRVFEELGRGEWAQANVLPGPEAAVLELDSTKARDLLGWRPRVDLATAIAWTCDWYRTESSNGDCAALCRAQIDQYLRWGQA